KIKKVTIIGAGTQGSMLAFRSALYDKDVVVFDLCQEATKRAMKKIKGWLSEYVGERKITEKDKNDALKRVNVVNVLQDALKDADLVIENVPEKLALKQKVWAEIDALSPEKTLLTTNSSSLKSSDIGVNVKRKDKTFNVNFMTPIKDDLVEVMWNLNTSDKTKEIILAFLKSNKHIPIITNKEIKGFSLNRVWRAMKKECLNLWAEGYIDPSDFDRAFVLEWGTNYGPFALMDKVGMDVVRDIEYSYYAESQDEKDKPPKALDEMIQRGALGEKSGRGFYEYPNPAYEQDGWLQGE
ncbi:MAG: 3-hydroxyacyl-CoA dehydrogenase family protein, partial [Halanaerobiales bacterium]|nr:3-hydroxyacyl-CoA dehydrogenase family protein [Halanaerobiales bacterium]